MSILSGATRGAGGQAIARHLLKTLNGQTVQLIPSRGLAAETLHEQVRELASGSIATRTSRPLWHLHFDPVRWDEATRSAFWARLEAEFDLGEARYVGAIHDKAGRRHEHRLYDITADDGRVADMGYERMRREKVACVVAYEHGLPLPPVPHLRAIAKALEIEGRHEAAAWVRGDPRTDAPAPVALVSPPERALEQRKGTSKLTAAAAVLSAWRASDTGAAFQAALAETGMVLASGSKVPVVVDATGVAWPLARLLGQLSRAEAGGIRISVADAHNRIGDLELPNVEEVRRERQGFAAVIAGGERAIERAPSDGPSASESGAWTKNYARDRHHTPRRGLGGREYGDDHRDAFLGGGRSDPIGARADASDSETPARSDRGYTKEPERDQQIAHTARSKAGLSRAGRNPRASRLAEFARQTSEDVRLGPLGRSLRSINEQQEGIRRLIATLESPVSAPKDLELARKQLSQLSDAARGKGSDMQSVTDKVDLLKRNRPRGVWAWLSGQQKAHDALTALTIAEHARIAEAAAAAKVQQKRLEQRLMPREAGWQKKIGSIQAERASRLGALRAELQWLADAHAAMTLEPELATAPAASLAKAVSKRQSALVEFKHEVAAGLRAQSPIDHGAPSYRPR